MRATIRDGEVYLVCSDAKEFAQDMKEYQRTHKPGEKGIKGEEIATGKLINNKSQYDLAAEQIIELYNKGYSYNAIAATLGLNAFQTKIWMQHQGLIEPDVVWTEDDSKNYKKGNTPWDGFKIRL